MAYFTPDIYGSSLRDLPPQEQFYASMNANTISGNLARQDAAQRSWNQGVAQNEQLARQEQENYWRAALVERQRQDEIAKAKATQNWQTYTFDKTLEQSNIENSMRARQLGMSQEEVQSKTIQQRAADLANVLAMNIKAGQSLKDASPEDINLLHNHAPMQLRQLVTMDAEQRKIEKNNAATVQDIQSTINQRRKELAFKQHAQKKLLSPGTPEYDAEKLKWTPPPESELPQLPLADIQEIRKYHTELSGIPGYQFTREGQSLVPSPSASTPESGQERTGGIDYFGPSFSPRRFDPSFGPKGNPPAVTRTDAKRMAESLSIEHPGWTKEQIIAEVRRQIVK